MGERVQVEFGVRFGQRLAELRKATGFKQVEPVAELGVSQLRLANHFAVSHTYPATGASSERVRMNSACEAARSERRQHENESRSRAIQAKRTK